MKKIVMLTLLCLIASMKLAFAVEVIETGTFEFTKNHIDLRETLSDKYKELSCRLLKLSPSAEKILITCKNRQYPGKYPASLIVFERNSNTYTLMSDVPGYLADWVDENTILFLTVGRSDQDYLNAHLMDLNSMAVKTREIANKESIGRRFDYDDFKAIKYSGGYVYLTQEIKMNYSFRYAINIEQPYDVVHLQELFLNYPCEYNVCSDDKYIHYPFNAATKSFILYPKFRYPFRSRLRIPYRQISSALSGNVGATINYDKISIFDYSTSFADENIDGWDSLNLISGTRESKADISGKATLGSRGSDLAISFNVTDDVLIVSDSTADSQDRIEIWLHTQAETGGRLVNGKGTYHFVYGLGENNLLLVDKGRYRNQADIEEAIAAAAEIEVDIEVNEQGYVANIGIPSRVYRPMSSELRYQINVVDVDQKGGNAESVITTNTNLRRFFEADVSVFNSVVLPELTENGVSK
ncbi:sugar-binding protein [Reinekea marinisedimentorum]|uniref:Carbohydrate binding protein with CBM9 domain n=1 Tax=Reinekea marinisedimentorum TaxID=230495 RepID=A0A4R3HRI4_9GAMM|nr:sugar-binding protein [Reinekea marinisedimentorum]TCS35528.1 carbohydrate binding protein with CBM9 domain [Reinekea marinisedimentorum]